MKNKILLSLICGLLILGITTGCGKQANSNGSNDKDMQSTDVVDWSEFKINLDSMDYNHPYSISQFLANNWQIDEKYTDIINQTVSKAGKVELTEEEKELYEQNNIDVESIQNNICVYLNKNNSTIYLCVDNTPSETLVKNANVIYLSTSNANFSFYGIKNNSTIEDVKRLFGTKNYEIDETDKSVKAEYHNSISYYESYGQVLFMLDNNAKLVKGIQITIK